MTGLTLSGFVFIKPVRNDWFLSVLGIFAKAGGDGLKRSYR